MSVREDDILAEDNEDTEETKGFENDFTINERQIVRFPTNMGVSGYALRGDAVCFVNNFSHKQ